MQKLALVTGASRGIGLEIVRQLLAADVAVLAGVRDPARATLGIPIALDVTDAASIAAAAARIRAEFGRLDILVNNAGIAKGGPPSTASLADVREVFETNVFGVIAVTQAMLPLLRESPAGRIVNVSSGIGSLTRVTDPSYEYKGAGGLAYGPSKSALNHVTIAFAQELAGTRIKVNAACPGYTATDLNGHRGARTVAQGAREPVRLALLPDDGPTGGYTNEDGPLPY